MVVKLKSVFFLTLNKYFGRIKGLLNVNQTMFYHNQRFILESVLFFKKTCNQFKFMDKKQNSNPLRKLDELTFSPQHLFYILEISAEFSR
ncbi:hypothetical protein BpHYR1_037050 [Brachionus plicatilis]|uniref:Uncharacterized protein n=1 Tax=Brachionus plicatilis TaxID=10195 RepID=A0A3M7SME3_BRAPC|nr:hypothetical protein BpHYR1_037050 [Brachionus plicatilis]